MSPHHRGIIQSAKERPLVSVRKTIYRFRLSVSMVSLTAHGQTGSASCFKAKMPGGSETKANCLVIV